MKKCNKCEILKELFEFGKHKTTKDGLRNLCKSCHNEMNKEWRKKNGKEYYKKYYKKYNASEKHKADCKKWILKNPEYNKNYQSNYYLENKENILESKKKYREENKDKIKENYLKSLSDVEKLEKRRDSARKYQKSAQSKKKRKERRSYRWKNDISFKTQILVRRLIRKSFENSSFSKNMKTEDIVGCKFSDFKLYLESKFESWMTWENYGLYNGELNYGWDIDHIIPISTARNESEIICLNHYTNLQPLCSKINRDIKKDLLIFNYEDILPSHI